ncbi:MAG: hypothetical protein N3H31_04610 [Candidatus Nezhaarchaeota archaeon]|nr:hypothetical protein [Candidatus Nezhaarchaeota archaeon]
MGLGLPSIELDVGGRRVKLLLPCSRLEEAYEGPLMAELEGARGLRLKAWRRLARLFDSSSPPPPIKVVRGPYFMVHQNFIVGGALSSLPMFLRHDGERFLAEFYQPVVALNPYVYYFEGVIGDWSRPVLMPAIIHEYAHVAFLQGRRLRLEAVRRVCLNARMAMQLPFIEEGDLELMERRGEEVDALMEAPALWAEQFLVRRLGFKDHVEARLSFQEARDEALRRLMSSHGIHVLSPPARQRTELLRKHLEALGRADVKEVEAYVEEGLKSLLGETYEKIQSGLVVEERSGLVETLVVTGRMVERLETWRRFLRKAFGYLDA